MCRGGALGDFVVTLPVLQALRAAWPGARLDLLAYPRHALLAQAGGLADAVRSLDDAAVAAWFDPCSDGLPESEVRLLDRYDCVICFLHDPDGGVQRKLVRAIGARAWFHSPLVRAMHAADHLLEVLASVGIPAVDRVPRLRLPSDVVEKGRRHLGGSAEQVLVLHPGSGSMAKNWPVDSYCRLAEWWAGNGGLPAFLLGEAERSLAGCVGRHGTVLEGLPLLEAAGVLASVRGYVGNDSGISHLAAAVGARVVALFGPTDPALWAPRGPEVKVVRAHPPDAAGLLGLPVCTVEEALASLLGDGHCA